MKKFIYIITSLLIVNFSFGEINRKEIDLQYQSALEMLEIDANEAYKLGINLLNESKQIEYSDGIGKGNRIIGKAHHIMANYKDAQESFKNALEIFQKNQNKQMESSLYRDLGEFNRATKQFNEAINYLNKAMSIAEEIKDTNLILLTMNRFSAVLLEKLELKQSEEYVDKAINLMGLTRNISPAVISSLYNLKAVILSNRNEIDSSYIYSMKAYNIAKENNYIYEQITDLRNIVYILNQKGEKHKALELTKTILEDSKKSKFTRFSIIISSIAGDICMDLGHYKEAAEFFDYRFKLLDTIANPLMLSKVKLENTKLSAEISQKELQIKENEFRAKILIAITIIGFLLSISFFTLYYYRTKNRFLKNQNNALEEKNKIINDQNLKLEELNATKDKFFSIIAHDLKNPVFALNLSTKVLSENYEMFPEEERIELIRENHKSTIVLQNLLESLLTWSRSQSGNIHYNPEFHKLKKIVNMSEMLLENNAKIKNIKLINLIDDEVIAYFDLNLINTVVRNILSNAIKFSPQNSSIEISIYDAKNPDYLGFEIRDFGIGITKENIENIFDVGKNRSTTGTNGEIGTGLGLIICKEFIEKNNGKITVESEIGKGTSFKIYLPKKP